LKVVNTTHGDFVMHVKGVG